VELSWGDSVGLGLGEASVALRLGDALTGGVFLAAEEFEVVTGSGELLVPLELRGSESWGVALPASGLGGFSVLGLSSPFEGSFVGESDSISYKVLYDL
jgi:hypothetical protein